MNDFVKCNKFNGVYWLKNPIDTLTVKVKTRPQNGLMQLPRFDQYNQPDLSEHNLNESIINEFTFKWQNKVFSRHEIEKYSNVHNCTTDTELGYIKLLQHTQHEGNKMFTYINEDYYRPFPIDYKKEDKQLDISFLNSCFEKLNLEGHDKVGRVFNDGSGSMIHLFKSKRQIPKEIEEWTAMHIVYDKSEYNEDNQLLLKQESTLLSLHYNATKNYLILSPDTNDLELNPYTVDVIGIGLQYAIEIGHGDNDNEEELVKMLNKLYKKWEKSHKQLVNITSPPLGRKRIFIAFEIVSAENFETDNMYIEFNIKIPDDVECEGTLNGKTHTTSALETDDGLQWNYGHTIDLELEISTGIDPSPIKLYLEVISVDRWRRHRTEGYSALRLGLRPGGGRGALACARPDHPGVVEAETRRFFLGGCNLVKDLDVLDNPALSTNDRWVSSGTVRVRWSVLVQGGVAGRCAAGGGAAAALRRYRRAAAALAAARELCPR